MPTDRSVNQPLPCQVVIAGADGLQRAELPAAAGWPSFCLRQAVWTLLQLRYGQRMGHPGAQTPPIPNGLFDLDQLTVTPESLPRNTLSKAAIALSRCLCPDVSLFFCSLCLDDFLTCGVGKPCKQAGLTFTNEVTFSRHSKLSGCSYVCHQCPSSPQQDTEEFTSEQGRISGACVCPRSALRQC